MSINEFDWSTHISRILKDYRNGYMDKKHSVHFISSSERMELLKEIKRRNPKKRPTQIAEIFTRYFRRYGTYKIANKHDSKMNNIDSLKEKVRNRIKDMGMSFTALEDVTPYKKATISTNLAPSGNPDETFLRICIEGINKLKKQKGDEAEEKENRQARKIKVRDKMKTMERPFSDLSKVTPYKKNVISNCLAPSHDPSESFLNAMERGVEKLQDQEKKEILEKAEKVKGEQIDITQVDSSKVPAISRKSEIERADEWTEEKEKENNGLTQEEVDKSIEEMEKEEKEDKSVEEFLKTDIHNYDNTDFVEGGLLNEKNIKGVEGEKIKAIKFNKANIIIELESGMMIRANIELGKEAHEGGYHYIAITKFLSQKVQ